MPSVSAQVKPDVSDAKYWLGMASNTSNVRDEIYYLLIAENIGLVNAAARKSFVIKDRFLQKLLGKACDLSVAFKAKYMGEYDSMESPCVFAHKDLYESDWLKTLNRRNPKIINKGGVLSRKRQELISRMTRRVCSWCSRRYPAYMFSSTSRSSPTDVSPCRACERKFTVKVNCFKCSVKFFCEKGCENTYHKYYTSEGLLVEKPFSLCYDCRNLTLTCNFCRIAQWHPFQRDINVCTDCLESRTPSCIRCNTPLSEWGGFCNRCGIAGLIKEYNYAMPLIFRHRLTDSPGLWQRYFGVELEATAKVTDGYAKAITWLADYLAKNKLGCLKKDSSTGCLGVEINFQPMTFSFIKKELEENGLITSVLDCFKSNGWLSHNAPKNDPDAMCGMHVHTNLSLRNKSAMNKSKVYRMNRLIYQNQEWFRKISQRTSEAVKRYCSPSNASVHVCAMIKRGYFSTKHVPINIQKNTIEFRLFSGTLIAKRFAKNVQLVDAMLDYCENNGSFLISDFIIFIHKNEKRYAELIEYIEKNMKRQTLELERVA